MFSDLYYRLRAIFHRNSMEEDLEDELRFHLECEVEKLVRKGVAREEALRQSQLEFGGTEQVREECRDARGIGLWDVTGQILRYALRQHSQRPAFAVLVVLILALGIGASTALFSMVKAILIAPLPYPESGRLVMIWERNLQGNLTRELVTPGDFADWKEQAQSFVDLAFSPAWPGARRMNLVVAGGVDRVAGAYVSSSWFRVLRVNPAHGRACTS
jgi:putative ABC transport system permease protein